MPTMTIGPNVATYEYDGLDEEIIAAIDPARLYRIRHAARLLGLEFNDLHRARHDTRFVNSYEKPNSSPTVFGGAYCWRGREAK